MYEKNFSWYPSDKDARYVDTSIEDDEDNMLTEEDLAFKKLVDDNRTKNSVLSVIIITENIVTPERFEHFTRCLNSINTQWFGDVEIVAADNASTDGTQTMLQKYYEVGIVDRYYPGTKGNVYDVMNIAAEKFATGEYVTFIHFDDFYHSKSAFFDIISKMKDENLDFVTYETKLVSDKSSNHPAETLQDPESLVYRYAECNQGAFYRRSVFISEKFDLRYLWANDYELTIRLLLKGYRNFAFRRTYKTTNFDRIEKISEESYAKEVPRVFFLNYNKICGLKEREAHWMSKYNFIPLNVLFFLRKKFTTKEFFSQFLKSIKGLLHVLKDKINSLKKNSIKTTQCPICGAKHRLTRKKTLFDSRYGFFLKANYSHCPECGLEYCTEKRNIVDQLTLSRLLLSPKMNLQEMPDLPPMRCWIDDRKRDRNKLFAEAFRWVPLGVRILDVGCGDCQKLIYHKLRQCDVYGIDIMPKSREIGRENGIKNITVCPFEKAKYKNRFFDYITMEQFIEHSADPKELLEQAFKYLRPNGRLVITTPNANSIYRYLFGRKWLGWNAPYHYRIFTKKSLKHLAEKAGYRVIYLETLTPPHTFFDHIFHLKAFPKYLHPSKYHFKKKEKTTDDCIQKKVIYRFLRNIGFHQFLSRGIDKLDIGDTIAAVLERPENTKEQLTERERTSYYGRRAYSFSENEHLMHVKREDWIIPEDKELALLINTPARSLAANIPAPPEV